MHAKRSLPSWERGLKFCNATMAAIGKLVAPLVGARIEISVSRFFCAWICVAPLVGARIEISAAGFHSAQRTRRSPRGSED